MSMIPRPVPSKMVRHGAAPLLTCKMRLSSHGSRRTVCPRFVSHRERIIPMTVRCKRRTIRSLRSNSSTTYISAVVTPVAANPIPTRATSFCFPQYSVATSSRMTIWSTATSAVFLTMNRVVLIKPVRNRFVLMVKNQAAVRQRVCGHLFVPVRQRISAKWN